MSGQGADIGSEEHRELSELCDLPVVHPSGPLETMFHGLIWDVVGQDVDLGAAGTVRREYLRHPGAVWVMVLDEHERVLLQRQYRHAVRAELWEPPAGLRDVAGEPPLLTAQRELAEEADLVAARWDVLLEMYTSPGGSNEVITFYLARELSAVPDAARHQRTGEELGMPSAWVQLDDAIAAVFGGQLHSPSAVTGVLALDAYRRRDWQGLRPAL